MSYHTMSSHTTPVRLDFEEESEARNRMVGWRSIHLQRFSFRSMCSCAICEESEMSCKIAEKESLLTIFYGNYLSPIHVISAELVDNYAMSIEWSDQHGSGIYLFAYLREINSQKS